jgi:hypothetical protein
MTLDSRWDPVIEAALGRALVDKVTQAVGTHFDETGIHACFDKYESAKANLYFTILVIVTPSGEIVEQEKQWRN